MHLCDTISDLYIEFQTSSVPTGEENHLRVCRKSRYLQNDFSILSDPISQKWFGPHWKLLISAFQRHQLFEKIPTTARDMIFWILSCDFFRIPPAADLPEALWRHCDVIGQNKYHIRKPLKIFKNFLIFFWKKFKKIGEKFLSPACYEVVFTSPWLGHVFLD